MKYRVKLLNDCIEPYWTANDCEPVVGHKIVDEYVVYNDEKTFYKLIDDFLDAPKKKLTEKDIRKDFDENRETKLSKSRVEAIRAYYNGRLALKKRVYADLAKVDVKKMEVGFPSLLKYSIPREMNYFSCEDNDQWDAKTKQNDSYLEIEISKEN